MTYLNDEQEYLLKSLLALTKKHPEMWQCIEYNPLSILMSEEDDGTENACICHLFYFCTEVSNVKFSLELYEKISFDSEKGDIFITLEKHSPAEDMTIDTGLSFEEEYDDCPVEQTLVCFKEHLAVQFADILIPYALQTDIVSDALQKVSFENMFFSTEKIKNNSLYRLGEIFFKTGQLIDFHRSVLDFSYRKKFISAMDDFRKNQQSED